MVILMALKTTLRNTALKNCKYICINAGLLIGKPRHKRFVGSFNRVVYFSTDSANPLKKQGPSDLKLRPPSKLSNGPDLHYFLNMQDKTEPNITRSYKFSHPYLALGDLKQKSRTVYIETYGCQMNVNDTEIARSILNSAGFIEEKNVEKADVILVMTCAIREGAEQKIWNRLVHLTALKRRREEREHGSRVQIGLLGCMAERLKEKVIEKEKLVDIVAGPDSYRDLPLLLSAAGSGNPAINVQLSLEETYADILPVRVNPDAPTAFVSIMRGCDNMCSYCIVPFTRGRERSRPISSILDEVKMLSEKGIKEVTLLGQNVNSYRDITKENEIFLTKSKPGPVQTSPGFKTIYKTKHGGVRFADLLDHVSNLDPEMRIRFTSVHPKDFPDEVLSVIKERPNICNQLHLPAQSGNTEVLRRMRRGYSREAYLELVQRIHSILPDVAFISDFICGFCGETDEEHLDTLSLIELVKYQFCYVFPYSMREKTNAFHRLKDEVPLAVKKKRVDDVTDEFRRNALVLNRQKIKSKQLVLVEGASKRSSEYLSGRCESSTKVIFSDIPIPSSPGSEESKNAQKGDYVVVQIEECSSQVLKGTPLYITRLQEFSSTLHDLQ